jgi:hypothetical protein
MKFICQPIVDKEHTIKWIIIGGERAFRGTLLEPLKDRVRLEFPEAEFEESKGVPWGQECFKH